eukprot:5423422-Prymnesium_polylepis.1
MPPESAARFCRSTPFTVALCLRLCALFVFVCSLLLVTCWPVLFPRVVVRVRRFVAPVCDRSAVIESFE